MPLYEYRCPSCKLSFELLRSVSASGEDAECPRCRSKSPRKMSTFACFSKGSEGLSMPISGGGGGCGTCGSSNCSTCS